MRKRLFIVWGLLLGMSLAQGVWADEETVSAGSSVVINEIMWDGDEYVELYNASGEDVSLAGWQLIGLRGDLEEEAEERVIVEFDDEDEIGAGEYFLIEKKESATEVDADKIPSGMSLLNSGEKLELVDDGNDVVDEANWLGAWYAGENTETGVSMERLSGTDGSTAGAWYTSTGNSGEREGTPGEENSEPAVNAAPVAVISVSDEDVDLGEEISFSAEGSSDEEEDDLSFSWDMGDGSDKTQDSFEYEYEKTGTFTVSLVVSDGELEDETSVEVTVSKRDYSDKIIINEFLPNPAGSDSEKEFIELRNTGSDEVDLSGWKLDDKEDGGSSPHKIENVVLKKGEIKAIYRDDTGIALNNSGDSVRLLDPSGEEKDDYSYDETMPDDVAWARNDNGDWQKTTKATPGEKNEIVSVEDDEGDDVGDANDTNEHANAANVGGSVAGAVSVKLADARGLPVGSKVSVAGTVSVPPGVLSTREMYLAGSGMQVYLHAADWPKLKLGDVVNLSGELTNYRGEMRLKLAKAGDIAQVKAGEVPQPHQIKTGDIDESKEGWLVIFSGLVTETDGDTFYVDDGSGEVKVYIKDMTGIDKPRMRSGKTVVTVTGVVSETTSGYRVLPRHQEDVRLGSVAGLKSFPTAGMEMFGAAWVRDLASIAKCFNYLYCKAL